MPAMTSAALRAVATAGAVAVGAAVCAETAAVNATAIEIEPGTIKRRRVRTAIFNFLIESRRAFEALSRAGIECAGAGFCRSPSEHLLRRSLLELPSGELYVKTLFLSPPSFDGFDGGAGARYQAKREVTSYWYPTWLAQPAAMVPGSILVDAAPHHQTIEDVLAIAKDRDLVIMHTSTPSLPNDVECARRLKEQNPNIKVGFIGAHVAVLPDQTLRENEIIDFVCRNEFDYTCKELAEGRPWNEILGLSYRDANGELQRTEERPRSAIGTRCRAYCRSTRSFSTSRNITTGIFCIRTSRGTPVEAARQSARSVSGRKPSVVTSSDTRVPRRLVATLTKPRQSSARRSRSTCSTTIR